MTPIPYQSKFTSKIHYLAQTIKNGKIVTVIVVDHQQPDQGSFFPKMNDATQWLTDNGFQKIP